jgi:hypothetical protein
MLGSALVRDPMFDAAARAKVVEDLVISWSTALRPMIALG